MPTSVKHRKGSQESVADYRFRELLESVYDAILITDIKGNIVKVNARAEEFFLMERELLCQTTARKLISGFTDAVYEKVVQSLEDHKHILLDAMCVRSDQTAFPAEVAVHRIYLTPNAQLCFSIRDVTARKEAERKLTEATEELLRAEKLKARLNTITTLAHEINNPLQILLSLVELDRNTRYVEPLKRIMGVMEALRNRTELKEVNYVGSMDRYEIPAQSTVPSQSRRILIADDEIAVRKVFATILRAEFPEFEIDLAANGKEAVESFAQRHHMVLVLDVSMPVMNGEEAFFHLRRICRENAWDMPSVIFCTGFTPPETILEVVRKENLHCYQPKPISAETLVSVMRDCLEIQKLRQTRNAAG